MGVTERRVRKLLRRMKKQEDAVVVHRLRGQACNRKLPAKTKKQALAILRKPDWHDFGPTFAAGQLAKHHRIQVGKETLRGRIIEAGGKSAWMRVSSTAPLLRCGGRSATEPEDHLENALFYSPKPRLGSFTKQWIPAERTPPGAPETLTGSASQEESRRLLRSQPRRLGFGQLRQARPRLGCANITTWVSQLLL